MPIVNQDKLLIGFDARIYILPNTEPIEPMNPQAKYLRPANMKTKDVIGIVEPLNNKEVSETLIVEGILDAYAIATLGYRGACNFGMGAASPNKVGLVLAAGTQTIISCFDNDEAGKVGWSNIRDSWANYIPIGKPNELVRRIRESGYKDPGEYLESLNAEK